MRNISYQANIILTEEDNQIWRQAALAHLDALYGFAMALSQIPYEAEDLVQETYAQAEQAYHRLRPDSNIKSWLFVILRNIWLKQRRREQHGPEFVELDEEQAGLWSYANDPQVLYVRIWEREEVRNALKQLPLAQRQIIVLRDIEGFSYKEIAIILDCPLGTIMSRLARARQAMKQRLSTPLMPPLQKYHK